jgi:hypothetical protein
MSQRAARALAQLGEVDAALAVLSLWCIHRDGSGATCTTGDLISYGPAFDQMALPEQVGMVAHHVLHVALHHSARAAGLAQRLGASFDQMLYGLAADGIINETLILAGHAIPRPAVILTDLLKVADLPAESAVAALEQWDSDRLAMALHAAPDRARRLRDWGKTKGFAVDLGPPKPEAKGQTTTDWRNHVLRAFEAGRKAGTGIGRLGAFLADIAPDTVPWEAHLRGILAHALIERPRITWRRPSGAWIARMAAADTPPPFEPGRQRMDHRAKIVIGLDTSSSIDPQTLRLFYAEARSIARRTGAEVHLLAFDETVFLQTNLDAAADIPMRSGGGTDFQDLFGKIDLIRPSIAVILTDLDAPLPPPPKCPLIWAVPKLIAAPAYGRLLCIGNGG